MKITVECEHGLPRTVEDDEFVGIEHLQHRVHAVVLACPGCAYQWSPQIVQAKGKP